MKIVLLTGSPHPHGTSATLADYFEKGVREAGKHDLYRFDAAFRQVNYCIGCDVCNSGDNPCVYADDFADLVPQLIAADIVVFVTPMYYHDMTAQLKTVLDRFHGINKLLLNSMKKVILITTAYQAGDWVIKGYIEHMNTTLPYIGWEKADELHALACGTVDDLFKTDYPAQAYAMGYRL